MEAVTIPQDSARKLAPDARILALVAVVAIGALGCAILVAVELPLGGWDPLSFGTWARSIAADWPHLRFATAGPADYHRPLFYFLEGTLWHVFGFHESLARLLGLTFGVVLAASIGYSAARLAGRPHARLSAAIAVAFVLAVTPFERAVVDGLTDVPVAAMVAVTGAFVLAPWRRRVQLPLVAVAACLAVLTKPNALPSLVGLGAAVALGPRSGLRRRTATAAALAAGTVPALIYDEVQARLSHVDLHAFLTAGSTGFYSALSAHDRSHQLLDQSWLGGTLRVLLVFGLVYALARLVLPHRRAVVAAFAFAVVWSVLGPALAGMRGGLVPEVPGMIERAAVLLALASTLFALAAPSDALASRLELARLLVWLAPPLLVWLVYSAYDPRLLSAAWPPLLLLMTRAYLPAITAAGKIEPRLAAPAAAGVIALAACGTLQLAGFGSDGWHRFSTGLGNAQALRDLAFGGDFAVEMKALAPQVASVDRIVSADSRLAFYYPAKASIEAPTACTQLHGATALVLLESDEERTLYGRKAEPAFWLACTSPKPVLVDERPGAFALFTTGTTTAVAGGCGATPLSGLTVEFGRASSPQAAQALLMRVKGLGFVQAAVQRIACTTYAVIEGAIPSRQVGESVVAEAKSAQLDVRLIDAP